MPKSLVTVLTPIPVEAALYWIEVYLDRQLTFKGYVFTEVNRTRKVAACFRLLGGVFKGAPAVLLCQAVSTCITSIITYAAEYW